jgi:hypothetical protein
VFQSALRVGQRGRITRIASGCSEEQQRVIQDRYARCGPHARPGDLPSCGDAWHAAAQAVPGTLPSSLHAAVQQGVLALREGRSATPASIVRAQDEATGKTYHFYNKPRGLLHFLTAAAPPLDADSIIALIDPDFAFLRKLARPDSIPRVCVSLTRLQGR